MRTIDCSELVELAPELAVGNLCGDERAAAVAHLADCVACQSVVNAFTAVTDRLLLIAPRAEPPAGFEQRVLAALPTELRSRRRRRPVRRWAPLLAAAALAVTFLSGGLLLDLGGDDDPAFAAADMRTASGEVVGHVLVHDAPATLSMTLPGWAEQVERLGLSDGGYQLRIETADGRTASRPVTLTADAAWAMPLDAVDVDPDAVTTVALVGSDGYVWCEASFDAAGD